MTAAKAHVASLIAGLTALTAALPEGVALVEAVGVALAALVAWSATFWTSNTATAPTPEV